MCGIISKRGDTDVLVMAMVRWFAQMVRGWGCGKVAEHQARAIQE